MLSEYKIKEVDSMNKKCYISKEYSILKEVQKHNINESSKLEDNNYNTKESIRKYFIKKLQLKETNQKELKKDFIIKLISFKRQLILSQLKII